jgi:DNA-binding SARP family transcriptional activator
MPDEFEAARMTTLSEAAVALTVRVGAAVTVHEGEQSINVLGKPAALLACVVLEGQVDRRRMADMLWPRSPESQARNNLRVLVHRINQRAGVELLVGRDLLTLNAASAQRTLEDSEAVLAALQAGGTTRCVLLADAGVDDGAGEALQAWLAQGRQRVRRRQLAVLNEALAQARSQGQTARARAEALARACVQLEPMSEIWHRQLMEVLGESGDRAAALAAYEACKQLLRQELGVLPDLLTRTVQLRILQQQALGLEPQASEWLTPLGGAAKYPLVERESLLLEARLALQRGLHVALQGEPGVGKTRLLRHLVASAGAEQVEHLVIPHGLRGEPYAALALLLQEVQPRRHASVGAPEQIELARLAPLAFSAVRPSEASLSVRRLHAALQDWVRALAEAGVKVLVIDDLHHADAASQAALAAMFSEGVDLEAHDAGPALLLGFRIAEIEPALQETLITAQARHRARCLEVPRLTLAGVLALLQAMDAAKGRSSSTEVLAAQLLRRTGGNPLFVIELARRELSGEPADEASLQALLQAQLARCSSQAKQLMAVAAVAGADFAVDLAVAVTGVSALGLMPSWAELQQRGLFADHGLAHDLVREAVLAATPQPISQLVHRQVAEQLEAQGQRGAAVLRHWQAGGEADRALPHAVHQLRSATSAGLPSMQLEAELLGLLERVSDPVLLDNLWTTAEIEAEEASAALWGRLEALAARVRRVSDAGPVRAWLAYEGARLQMYRDHLPKRAYQTASEGVDDLPSHGPGRVCMEALLSSTAMYFGGPAQLHSERAIQALEGLPDPSSVIKLRQSLRVRQVTFMPLAQALRVEASRMRLALRRGDRGVACVARDTILSMLGLSDYRVSALRHAEVLARWQAGDAADYRALTTSINWALCHLAAGRYRVAIECFTAVTTARFDLVRGIFMSVVWMQLGLDDRARACDSAVDMATLQGMSRSLLLAAQVRSALQARAGGDALAPFREAGSIMRATDATDPILQIVDWEIQKQTLPAAERLQAGARMIEGLKQIPGMQGHVAVALLDVAEAHAEAGSLQGRALALEAARRLRRRCASTQCLPEVMLRCADLLQLSDPAEADSLKHVARRRVLQSLPHVPPEALHSFVHDVEANRRLLGDDAEAAAAGTLR